MRPGSLSGTCLRLKDMYTNADGPLVNSKELEFKDQIKESTLVIVGVKETKLMRKVKPGL